MHTNNTNKNIIFPEISYKLTGIFYDVHNRIGRFCRERQYADEVEKLFKEKSVNYQREYNLMSIGNSIQGNRVDFLIDNKILVDIKAKNFITKDDYYQMMRYLKSTGLRLGLLVNFRNSHLKPRRIINIKNS